MRTNDFDERRAERIAKDILCKPISANGVRIPALGWAIDCLDAGLSVDEAALGLADGLASTVAVGQVLELLRDQIQARWEPIVEGRASRRALDVLGQVLDDADGARVSALAWAEQSLDAGMSAREAALCLSRFVTRTANDEPTHRRMLELLEDRIAVGHRCRAARLTAAMGTTCG